VAVGREHDGIDAERGRHSEERADVVDVPDRLADQHGGRLVKGRDHLVDGPIVERTAITTGDDAAMDLEADDLLEDPLRGDQRLDVGVACRGERVLQPRPTLFCDEDPSHDLRAGEHLLDHEPLLADEDARATVGPAGVAVTDVAEVLEPRVERVVDRMHGHPGSLAETRMTRRAESAMMKAS
jgi:hypothetical protein